MRWGREQRGRGFSEESGAAGFGDVLEDVSALGPKCGNGSEDPLHKQTPFFALGSEAGLAPDHRRADGLLGRVVRGLDALDPHEGPIDRHLF